MMMSGEMGLLGVFDTFYLTIVSGLLIIVVMPMTRCLTNVYGQTDEIEKLKNGKCEDINCTERHKKEVRKDSDGPLENQDNINAHTKPKLSHAEVYEFIHGKDTPVFKAIFASFF